MAKTTTPGEFDFGMIFDHHDAFMRGQLVSFDPADGRKMLQMEFKGALLALFAQKYEGLHSENPAYEFEFFIDGKYHNYGVKPLDDIAVFLTGQVDVAGLTAEQGTFFGEGGIYTAT